MKHNFKLQLSWSSADSDDNTKHAKTFKNHHVSVAGKPVLALSAAKAFKGDSSLHNPEDLLLASLTSCHMMSFLYCCAQAQIEVLSYKDDAEALLAVNADGSGRITTVLLNPVVEIVDPTQQELALSLHDKAHELCFIANSCNFKIVYNAIVKIA